MSDSNSMRGAGKSAITPDHMALLHTLAFTALRLCTAQIDAFVARLEHALAIQAGSVASEADADLLRAAHARLLGHGVTFRRLFSDALQRRLMQAVQESVEHVAGTLESGAMDLSLITFDAMERKVIIDNISQAIDRAGAEPLTVLNLRIAHWLGTEEIGTAHHPFRSAVFLKAASDAWDVFDAETAAHRLVLRQMQPVVFLQLVPVWQALNQELAIRHVLPDAERIYRNREAKPEELPQQSGDEALCRWLAPQGMHNVIEVRAGQLLDKTFEALSHDEAVPPGVRSLVASMQTHVRQVALANAQFFFDPRHPLRHALESCMTAGLSHTSSDDNVLLKEMEAICAKLAPGAVVDYAALADAFDALAGPAQRIPEARLRDAVAEAVKAENMSQAERRAEQDVLARIEGGEVDEVIESFLQRQWMRVLTFAYGMRNVKPDVLQKVLAAMDELLWSVKPKHSPEERKELADRLPALLSLLNAWLNVVKWEGQERDAFFSALAERHAAAMRAGDDSPRRTLEIRMDAVQRASEHQLSRRAQEQQEAEIAPYLQVIDGLDPGKWFVFVRNDGSSINCRLVWISPARTRFIFTGRQGQLLFTLDRDAFAQALRADRVIPIPSGEIVGRALSAALRELGAT